MLKIASELEKLTSYVGSRGEITVSDVDLLVGHSRQEKVFGVIDAIFSGDVSTALSQWEQVMATDRARFGMTIVAMGGEGPLPDPWSRRMAACGRGRWGARRDRRLE